MSRATALAPLIDTASGYYSGAGHFAWRWARGKLGGDPAFAAILARGLLSGRSRILDLGCGDGRIVLTAARKYGCRAVGVDIDPQRIRECEANKAKETKEVQKLVTFVKEDLFKTDLEPRLRKLG